jgi:hypothetical protein
MYGEICCEELEEVKPVINITIANAIIVVGINALVSLNLLIYTNNFNVGVFNAFSLW